MCAVGARRRGAQAAKRGRADETMSDHPGDDLHRGTTQPENFETRKLVADALSSADVATQHERAGAWEIARERYLVAAEKMNTANSLETNEDRRAEYAAQSKGYMDQVAQMRAALQAGATVGGGADALGQTPAGVGSSPQRQQPPPLDAGAALTSESSNRTFRSYGVPLSLCQVLESRGKTKPKRAQRKVLELLYQHNGRPRDTRGFRLLMDSETGMTDRDQQAGYEDAAALTLICPYLDAHGHSTERRPGTSICVASSEGDAKKSTNAMGGALDRLTLHTGLTVQRVNARDTHVTGNIVMGEASVISRMLRSGAINASEVTTLVFRDADIDCSYARQGLGTSVIFKELKRQCAQFRVLFCACKPTSTELGEMRKFAKRQCGALKEWSAAAEARKEDSARSPRESYDLEMHKGILRELLQLRSGADEDRISALFDELGDVHDQMEAAQGSDAQPVRDLDDFLMSMGDLAVEDGDDGTTRGGSGGSSGGGAAPPPGYSTADPAGGGAAPPPALGETPEERRAREQEERDRRQDEEDAQDLCDFCGDQSKARGYEFCGAECGRQASHAILGQDQPYINTSVQVWNQIYYPIEVMLPHSTAEGKPFKTIEPHKHHPFHSNEATMIGIYAVMPGAKSVRIGNWVVRREKVQHLFAEVMPNGVMTVRAMVCDEVDPSFDRAKNAPTKKAVENINRQDRLATIKEVARANRLQPFNVPAKQAELERKRERQMARKHKPTHAPAAQRAAPAPAPVPAPAPAPAPVRAPSQTVAELVAQARPGATWEELGGYYAQTALATSYDIYAEKCTLLKAMAICGVGTTVCGDGCNHKKCLYHATDGRFIDDAVGFTFEDKQPDGTTGNFKNVGHKPLGKVTCFFKRAGVAGNDDPAWHSYICPGQDVPRTKERKRERQMARKHKRLHAPD